MKKLLFSLMALAMITLSSCTSKTATVTFANDYSKPGMIMLSTDEKCSSIDEAACVAILEPGKMAQTKGVDLNGMYAIFYQAESTEVKETVNGQNVYTVYKKIGSADLTQFVGMPYLTVSLTSNGYYKMDASNM